VSLQKAGNRLRPVAALFEPSPAPPGQKRPRRSSLIYRDLKPLPEASHGQGIYIWDTTGKKYIDGCSGAISANLGHGNKEVQAAAMRQMDKISFTYRTQFESEPANELAELLVELSPPELKYVYFVNSGSEGVETAIKLARQFWWSIGKQSKSLIISRSPSYHGATLGALACTSYAPLNIPFNAMMNQFPKIPAPYCYHCPLGRTYPSCKVECAHQLEHVIDTYGADNIAALIVEPIGGASTGAIVPPDEYLPTLERICHEHKIILIIDDVLTGCGRTGTFFGYEHWDVTPDIVILSKGLSGGYTPVSAVLTTAEVAEPVLEDGGFKHGHTYAGNPLSTAIACEVIKIIQRDKLVENSRIVGEYMHEKLHEIQKRHPLMGDVRGKGLLAGVEFIMDPESHRPFPTNWMVGSEVTAIAKDLGLLIYPRRSLYGLRGDHVLIAPPLIIDRAGVDEMLGLFEQAVAKLERHLDERLAALRAEHQPAMAEDEEEYEEVETGQLPEGVSV
jgi:adenosylmethionine-8-amino-7-oxononanoate aminotransferase